MLERTSLKSVLSDKNCFEVKRAVEEGKYETVMKIRQSSVPAEVSTQRLEVIDTSDQIVAVVRPARVGCCFYIYTVQEPYPGAQKNSWNETLNGDLLYCFGYLRYPQPWWLSSSTIFIEKGAQADGKDDYKPIYTMQNAWFSHPDTIIYPLGDDGQIQNQQEAVAFVSRDRWQWDEDNTYAVEVAPGADAALMVISMAMLDEIREDINDSQ